MSNVTCPKCCKEYLHGHPDNPKCDKCGYIFSDRDKHGNK